MDDKAFVETALRLLPRAAVAAFLSIPPEKRRTLSVKAAGVAARKHGADLDVVVALLGYSQEAGGMPGSFVRPPEDKDVVYMSRDARVALALRATIEKASLKARCLADVFKIAETLRKE